LDRLKSAIEALQVRTLDRLARISEPTAVTVGGRARERSYLPEEVACALNLPVAAAGERVHQAGRLVNELPRTLTAMQRGLLSYEKAHVLMRATNPLDRVSQSRVETRVMNAERERHARTGSAMTVPEFRRATARAVAAVDPRGEAERHRDASAERDVRVVSREHGMGNRQAYLPGDALAAIMCEIERGPRRRPRKIPPAAGPAPNCVPTRWSN
jgi:hypothetical protein